MSNCHCNSNINPDGSGQLGRYLKALDPTYAPLDDRSMEDLLVYAKRYAGQIRFYDVPDSMTCEADEKGPVTWREFFRRDMAVIAASIATIDIAQIRKDYDELRTRLDAHPTAEIYTALYTNILGMAARIDGWYQSSLPDHPLRKDLDLGIGSSLRPAMLQIMAYEKGYVMVDGRNLKLDYSAITNATLWGLDEDVMTDATIYTGASSSEKLQSAALFVDDLFLTFYNFLQQLVAGSDAYLKFALERYPEHQPHMALFIAFLELFRLAQDQLNGLPGRMLDFYYRDVLRLTGSPSVPDRVHLIFELAKDVAEYDLEKSTALLAGKDASGVEQVYLTETDFVVNSAKVKELKTLFIQKVPGATATDPRQITAFYARSVANSQDGKGAKFTSSNPMWPSLGVGWPVINDPQNICEAITAVKQYDSAPEAARVGFAVASPQLLLQGGKRLIKISFGGLATLAAYAKNSATGVFDIYLTAEKSWLQLKPLAGTEEEEDALVNALSRGQFGIDAIDEPGYFIREVDGVAALYMYLPIATAPIIAFDAKVHTGGLYATQLPVMQILLQQDISISEEDYAAAKFTRLSIEVKVGSINDYAKTVNVQMDGLKVLLLQNDNGMLDPTKPCDPFTAYPSPGKSLYIGSNELFNKPLGEVAIDFRKTQDEISGNESSDDDYDYKVKVLDRRQWVALSSTNGEQFTRFQLSENIMQVRQRGANATGEFDTEPYSIARTPITQVKQWNGQQEKGFIRLDFAPYSNGQYSFAAEQSRATAPQYEIKEIAVSYHSILPRIEANIDQLFHVYPFGVAEVSLVRKIAAKELTGRETSVSRLTAPADPSLLNAFNRLLPQFTYTSLYNRYKVPANTLDNVKGEVLQQGPSDISYDTDWISSKFPKRADQLMLEASGLKEQESGQLNQYSALLQEEGLLFIGLEHTKPLQSISLLFQFAEGSAADEDNDPPSIHWTYLVNNEWRPLKAEAVLSDDTYGFQTTGIIRLEVPADATNNHSIITDGLYWFSASVTEYSNRIPQLVDIVAQAVLARFDDNQHAAAHFDQVLPGGSISKLSVAAVAIAKVSQPFASFDGKPRATGKAFYTQTSERLRHKGRAVNSWDYEHLVLDRFPSIYKVKCIQHTDPNCLCREVAEAAIAPIMSVDIIETEVLGETKDTSPRQRPLETMPATREVLGCCGPQIAPGHVLIVPIPNLKSRNAANPLQPKTSRRTLLEIQDYLKRRVSPFVHVHARNPVYEEIMVFFRVQFYAGSDKGFFLKKLNDELVHYLTPWAFDDEADVVFGQKVYASAIINFIEERPYVDFITDFVMDVCLHECCGTTTSGTEKKGGNDGPEILFERIHGADDMEELLSNAGFTGYIVATPSTARSILVSVPQHIIVPYEAPDKISPCQQRKQKITVPISEQPAQPMPEKEAVVNASSAPIEGSKISVEGAAEKDQLPDVSSVAPVASATPSRDTIATKDIAGVEKVDELKAAGTVKQPVKKLVDPALKKVIKAVPKKPGK